MPNPFNLTYNIYNTLILFGCLQGFLLALILLFNERYKKPSNFFLALLLITVSLSNLKICLIDTGATTLYPVLKYVPIIWPFFIPSLLYFFVQHLTNSKYRISKKERWLFAPFVINFAFQIILLITFYFQPETLVQHEFTIVRLNKIKEFLAIVYCLSILVLIINHLKQFEANLKDNYAELSGKSLVWLGRLIKTILFLWIFWALPYTYAQIQGTSLTYLLYPFWIGISVLIYWVAYSTISRNDVFEAPDFSSLQTSEQVNEKPEISDAIENHYIKLMGLMNEEKLYLDPNLNMTLLAEKMELSNGYLSQIINQKENKNFFDFINGFRVEEVKSKLNNPELSHYSVLGIALESGFNSKSTFNAVFKKTTGKTPSSFRNS